jgi:glycosyltransferase involved in cell wall biosynthesis
VTPFYNTREFLRECIESVVRQDCERWEYLLVDNCSNDGSSEIAAEFAALHRTNVRVVRTTTFLSQVENYNFALTCISPQSKYCKIVQADDWIYPGCINSMVEIGEQHPKVGVVGAYELQGDYVSLDGLPYPSPEVTGRDVCRRYLLGKKYLFGTPTSLLMRSELIRAKVPFYDERFAPFEDAHACFEAMKNWNFGFVHQVLTYSRRQPGSISARMKEWGCLKFSRLQIVIVHGREWLSAHEYRRSFADAERSYLLHLARAALRGRSKEFWDLHRRNLDSIGYEMNWRLLARWIPRAALEKLWESYWALADRGSSLPDEQ